MARFSWVGNEAIEPNFKRHGDAWIFRARGWNNPDGEGVLPAPWGAVSYIVSDAQKATLDPILRSIVDFVAKVTVATMLLSGALLGIAVGQWRTRRHAPRGGVDGLRGRLNISFPGHVDERRDGLADLVAYRAGELRRVHSTELA